MKANYSILGKRNSTIKIDISFESLKIYDGNDEIYPVRLAINCSKLIRWLIAKHKNLKEILLVIKKIVFVNKLNIPFFC